MELTNHGGKRIWKRIGGNKATAERIAQEALACGTERGSLSGNLRRFVDKKYYGNDPRHIVIHHGNLFVFGSKNGPLITAFSLPGGLKNKKASREI